MNEDEIIKQAETNFLEDDTLEPFANREYVEETKRIYDLLKNEHPMGDFKSPQDRAIFDVAYDLLIIAGEKRVQDTGEEFLNQNSEEGLVGAYVGRVDDWLIKN